MIYNKDRIYDLFEFINKLNGIADKALLSEKVKKKFALTGDRKVFYCDDFAIRFSRSETKNMSNTVLSLSSLQKYDDIPFFVCIVSSKVNHILLANSTFLKKISHSSKELRIDNIKGSFNGSDIMKEYASLENCPDNFEELFAYHMGLSFRDNLERLVESTNEIKAQKSKFQVDENIRNKIFLSVDRAQNFIRSKYYSDLEIDLKKRVEKVQDEIVIAALIDNVNLRGRVIEYLITDNGSELKKQMIHALTNKTSLPEFKTEDKLGDYTKVYSGYHTETDIKTKVLFLDGNPKAYNIDKLLEFLSQEGSVYMIYLLGIKDDGDIVARLYSFLDEKLIAATKCQHHWAGRNTRGVTQFIGNALEAMIDPSIKCEIDEKHAKEFLAELIER
ncbi:MAG: hypothetical protein Q4A75_00985 [Peptostreptococcaceae bacterium]|nr:hypothetical protein [Peptostreptococcaceae bacterium]